GMALTRWFSDGQSAKARKRDAWVIETMQALSIAALRKEGITSVLRELSNRLQLGVILIDSAGEPQTIISLDGSSRKIADQVVIKARELLSRNQRAGKDTVINSQSVHLQTLGRQSNLSGVLALVSENKLNQEELSVVTSAIALAELS